MMGLISEIRLAFQFRKLAHNLSRGDAVGYSWRLSLSKAFRAFAASAISIGLTAIVSWGSDPVAIQAILAKAEVDPRFVGVVVAVVVGALKFLSNWLKNRGR